MSSFIVAANWQNMSLNNIVCFLFLVTVSEQAQFLFVIT